MIMRMLGVRLWVLLVFRLTVVYSIGVPMVFFLFAFRKCGTDGWENTKRRLLGKLEDTIPKFRRKRERRAHRLTVAGQSVIG